MEDAASSSITFSCPSLSGRILNYWEGGGSDEPTMPTIGKSVKTLNRIIRLDSGSARGGSRLFARNGTPFGADQPERLSAEIREIAFLRPFVPVRRLSGMENSTGSRVEDSRAL